MLLGCRTVINSKKGRFPTSPPAGINLNRNMAGKYYSSVQFSTNFWKTPLPDQDSNGILVKRLYKHQ